VLGAGLVFSTVEEVGGDLPDVLAFWTEEPAVPAPT